MQDHRNNTLKEIESHFVYCTIQSVGVTHITYRELQVRPRRQVDCFIEKAFLFIQQSYLIQSFRVVALFPPVCTKNFHLIFVLFGDHTFLVSCLKFTINYFILQERLRMNRELLVCNTRPLQSHFVLSVPDFSAIADVQKSVEKVMDENLWQN